VGSLEINGRILFGGCFRFAADTEVEGVSKERRRLEEGDRGGHGTKTGRNVVEKRYMIGTH
jgi:hypothetical protein